MMRINGVRTCAANVRYNARGVHLNFCFDHYRNITIVCNNGSCSLSIFWQNIGTASNFTGIKNTHFFCSHQNATPLHIFQFWY